MVFKNPEIIYSLEDVNKAFAMGLESAIVVLEKSIGLSIEGQRLMIEMLKEKIERDKVEAVMSE